MDSWEQAREQLDFFRIGGLQEWLTDLGSAFPKHSARAVSLSLNCWRECAAQEAADRQGEELRDRLTLQGHLWRALLSGEKRGTDMLEPHHYLAAAKRLLARSGGTARSLVTAFPLPTFVVVVLVIAAVAVPAAFGGVGGLGGGIVAAAAALGVGWKGIGSALASLARELRDPLWGVELDYAIAEAIDRRPKADEAERRDVAPSGPQRAYRA